MNTFSILTAQIGMFVIYMLAGVILIRTRVMNRAVSYTHLDVYKRQIEKSVQDQCKLFIRINFFVFLIVFNVFSDSID